MPDPGATAAIMTRAPLRPHFAAEQTMSMPASARQWTVDEVRAMQDEERPWPRYELIEGELLVTPAPRRVHQRAVVEMFRLLDPFVTAHRFGVVELSPSDIQLAPGTIVQPDLFVSPLVDGHPPLHWRETTALVLAVEVISPSNPRADRVAKRRFYTRHNVAEYWVVDLEARIVERNIGNDPRPEVLDTLLEWTGAGTSEPLVIDLPAYFARVFAEEGSPRHAPG